MTHLPVSLVATERTAEKKDRRLPARDAATALGVKLPVTGGFDLQI
jgi:hypothetical protein